MVTFPTNRDGPQWKQQRTILNGYLLKAGSLSPYVSSLERVSDELLSTIRETADLQNRHETAILHLQPHLFKWALEGLDSLI